MITIAVTGPIGHGKTTFMRQFCRQDRDSIVLESGELITRIVQRWHQLSEVSPEPTDLTAINEWLKVLLVSLKQETELEIALENIKLDQKDIDDNPEQYAKLFEHLTLLRDKPELLNSQITAENKPLFRPILQWLGGYLVYRFGSGVWTDQLAKLGLQARSEGKNLCAIGALRYPTDLKSYEPLNPIVISVIRPELEGEKDKNDPTERERHKVPFDVQLINDGTIDDLGLVSGQILNDIRNDSLKDEYSASKT